MRKYAKAIVAIIGAVLASLSLVIDGGITTEEALAVCIALTSAVGVYLIPNLPGEDAVDDEDFPNSRDVEDGSATL